MFDNYFFRIDDCREIDCFIPCNEMTKIANELLGVAFANCYPKFLCRANDEFAQFTFMFHVEQLRESEGEVKTFWNEQEKLFEPRMEL